MKIEPLLRVPNADWLRMRRELWPDCDEAEHLAQMQAFLAQPDRYAQLMAVSDEGRSLGFAEASLRTDYLSGSGGPRLPRDRARRVLQQGAQGREARLTHRSIAPADRGEAIAGGRQRGGRR